MFIPIIIKELAVLFRNHGKKLYIVGGAIRDTILEKKPKDYDLATNATPEEVKQIVGAIYDSMYTGVHFGISRIFPKDYDKEGIEIATFRKDSNSTDKRRPDKVEYTDIITDLGRRDFTINSLALDIITEQFIDPFDGQKDLMDGIIRTVGDPYRRFSEDSMRKIRCIRFASTLGATIEEETSTAIKKEPSLMGVSKERIRDEFTKGLEKSISLSNFINLLVEHNLLTEMIHEPDIIRWFHKPKISDIKLNIPEIKLLRKLPYLIAYILEPFHIEDYERFLIGNWFTPDEASIICLLKDIQWMGADKSRWDDNGILKLKRKEHTHKLSKSDITSFLSLYGNVDIHFIKAYENFEPSFKENGLLEKGHIGKELGNKINEREFNSWKELIHHKFVL